MSSSTEALRTAIRDEALPLSERRIAAAHLIDVQIAEVPEPAEDDAEEVVALLTPPSADDETIRNLCRRAWEYRNETRGWASSGPTLLQARRFAHEKRREELLKTIYQDRDRHGLERESAAQRLLDADPPLSMWRKNGYTAQRLVTEAS